MDAPASDNSWSGLLKTAGWLAAMAFVLLSVAWAQRSDGRLHIYFLDTPGDAILVVS